MSTEIEFKWNANVPRSFYKMQRAVFSSGVHVLPVQNLKITDTYLDTPMCDFETQKIAFRVRCVNQNWEATFKTRTEIVHGKAVRREETLKIPGVKSLTQALEFLRRKKMWKDLCVDNLQPLFVLKNQRQIQEIIGHQMQAELAFDTCEILVCGRRVYFKEIELELKKGAAMEFEKLAAQLTRASGLRQARISKVKTALSLLNLWSEK